MKVVDTAINDVKLIVPNVYADARGFFMETYQKTRYQELLGIEDEFVQDNHSRSLKGVLRGLHFQQTNPQGKLVRVVQGSVFDVVVDIRPDSPTFKRWLGITLCDKERCQLWIPPGLAHGFVVMSEFADFEYKCTRYYDPASEACLLWNDAEIAVAWPVADPLLSPKDSQGKSFAELFGTVAS